MQAEGEANVGWGMGETEAPLGCHCRLAVNFCQKRIEIPAHLAFQHHHALVIGLPHQPDTAREMQTVRQLPKRRGCHLHCPMGLRGAPISARVSEARRNCNCCAPDPLRQGWIALHELPGEAVDVLRELVCALTGDKVPMTGWVR